MWTKSQKIAAAVLGLAATAFAVDRWVLGGPEGATAASSEYAVSKTSPKSSAKSAAPKAASGGNAGTTVPSTSPSVITPTVTLASRLAAIGQQRRLTSATAGDAFRPADAWLAVLLPPPPVESRPAAAVAAAVAPATRPVVRKVDYAGQFIKVHTLTAVMMKRAGGMAIIDGRLYAAGQTIDGFKLTKLGLNEATFTGKGTTAVLKMTMPPAGSTGGTPSAIVALPTGDAR